MRKTIVAIGLLSLLAGGVVSSSASAASIIPLPKSAVSALNGMVSDAGWRRCWRDRWGRMHCQWCWRDRWGRVICR